MYRVFKNGKVAQRNLNRRQAIMYVSALVQGKKFSMISSANNTIVTVKDCDVFKILDMSPNEESNKQGEKK